MYDFVGKCNNEGNLGKGDANSMSRRLSASTRRGMGNANDNDYNSKDVSKLKDVSMKAEGKELVIRVDLSKEFGASKSGKTTIIASTEGNVPFNDGEQVVFVGLNVYKK